VTALLETRNLSRRFGGLVALRDVSLEVQRGSVCGIIGPNGAGKTTLINVITGFMKPSSGRVLIDGRDITGAKPWVVARAHVARTFQIVKPFRDLTVRENVAMGSMFGSGKRRSLSQSRLDADDVLERVGLADRATAMAGELTVAEARRLELGKALAMRPQLLFLDEVMAGLRPQEIDQAVLLIRSLKDQGITIVAIEHVMKAILAISDVIFVLHEGKELLHGPPEQVASDTRVIEAYLGERYAKRHLGAKGA
jgi:branched-chain amino acid transport system ATP-binding protein